MTTRIDAHQHFWRFDPLQHGWITEAMSVLRRDFEPNELARELTTHGFDACIAVQAAQTDDETRYLLDLAADNDFIRGVVGWVDLRRVDVPTLLARYAQEPKLVGFRHIVQDEVDDDFLLRTDFCRGIEALGSERFSYDILIYPRQLRAATTFVRRFPEHRFVLDHAAKPPLAAQRPLLHDMWAAGLRELATAAPNLRCKVSGLVTEAQWHAWSFDDFARALAVIEECFGRRRLLYGSDWPVCLLAAESYGQVVAIVDEWTRTWSLEEREGFFGSNALDFYSL